MTLQRYKLKQNEQYRSVRNCKTKVRKVQSIRKGQWFTFDLIDYYPFFCEIELMWKVRSFMRCIKIGFEVDSLYR